MDGGEDDIDDEQGSNYDDGLHDDKNITEDTAGGGDLTCAFQPIFGEVADFSGDDCDIDGESPLMTTMTTMMITMTTMKFTKYSADRSGSGPNSIFALQSRVPNQLETSVATHLV